MPEPTFPTIQGLRVRPVRVPMPHRTASGTISESPLVLTDLITDAGVTGHSLTFTYTVAALGPTAELVANLEPLLQGRELAPADLTGELAGRFRLLGNNDNNRIPYHGHVGAGHGGVGHAGEGA